MFLPGTTDASRLEFWRLLNNRTAHQLFLQSIQTQDLVALQSLLDSGRAAASYEVEGCFGSLTQNKLRASRGSFLCWTLHAAVEALTEHGYREVVEPTGMQEPASIKLYYPSLSTLMPPAVQDLVFGICKQQLESLWSSEQEVQEEPVKSAEARQFLIMVKDQNSIIQSLAYASAHPVMLALDAQINPGIQHLVPFAIFPSKIENSQFDARMLALYFDQCELVESLPPASWSSMLHTLKPEYSNFGNSEDPLTYFLRESEGPAISPRMFKAALRAMYGQAPVYESKLPASKSDIPEFDMDWQFTISRYHRKLFGGDCSHLLSVIAENATGYMGPAEYLALHELMYRTSCIHWMDERFYLPSKDLLKFKKSSKGLELVDCILKTMLTPEVGTVVGNQEKSILHVLGQLDDSERQQVFDCFYDNDGQKTSFLQAMLYSDMRQALMLVTERHWVSTQKISKLASASKDITPEMQDFVRSLHAATLSAQVLNEISAVSNRPA